MVKNSKCPKGGPGNGCVHGECAVHGTKYCVECMPQPNKCTIKPCKRDRCYLFGTEFCVSGEIQDLSQELDISKLTENLKPKDMLKDISKLTENLKPSDISKLTENLKPKDMLKDIGGIKDMIKNLKP